MVPGQNKGERGRERLTVRGGVGGEREARETAKRMGSRPSAEVHLHTGKSVEKRW